MRLIVVFVSSLLNSLLVLLLCINLISSASIQIPLISCVLDQIYFVQQLASSYVKFLFWL